MMPTNSATDKTAGISDAAVKAATGRTWSQWIKVIDKAGGTDMSHKQIVAFLSKGHGVGPWWQQMVTVGYEQARGKRDKHQVEGGYQVSGSKTIAVPLATLYAAWADGAQRRRWLGRRALTVRKATPGKSMRITWGKDKTDVSVGFYAKGAGKSMVQLEHSRLPSAEAAAEVKDFWRKALEKLKASLE
jgi:uncharacterized protein YndB with AHSA1/START domain